MSIVQRKRPDATHAQTAVLGERKALKARFNAVAKMGINKINT